MKGILRRVKSYYVIANECLTNPATIDSDEKAKEMFDEIKKDRIAGQWYVQGVDGKVYRVNPREIEVKLDSLPIPIKYALLDGHDVEVEFSTTDKPRGKYLWVKKFELADVDKLTSWANSQPK